MADSQRDSYRIFGFTDEELATLQPAHDLAAAGQRRLPDYVVWPQLDRHQATASKI